MKVQWITTAAHPYRNNTLSGGSYYEYLATEALKRKFHFNLKVISKKGFHGIFGKVNEEYKFVRRLIHYRPDGDIIVRTHFPVAFTPYESTQKNIAIVNQWTIFFKPSYYYIPFFLHMLKKVDRIVVVCKYHRDWFYNHGYKNIEVIYNPFVIDDYLIKKDDINSFAIKYDLPLDKPIIYLGLSAHDKGVDEAYEVLKNLKAYFVSSGRDCKNKKYRCLTLSHSDQIRLMALSTIVLQMSLLPESWCRVLHEAMLCRTPVIGSGRGGMRELLTGGGQVICRDFKDLKKKANQLLNDDELRFDLGEKGYLFAKNFDYKNFEKKWVDLIANLD